MKPKRSIRRRALAPGQRLAARPPKPDPDAASPVRPHLADQIRELMRLVDQKSDGETLTFLSDTGLTLPQVATLHTLKQVGTLSVSAIAERLHLSMPATSHLIERMVRAGYTTRHEHAADRRQRLIRITADGAQVLSHLAEARAHDMNAALVGVPRPLLDGLGRALGEVVQMLRGEPGRPQR